MTQTSLNAYKLDCAALAAAIRNPSAPIAPVEIVVLSTGPALAIYQDEEPKAYESLDGLLIEHEIDLDVYDQSQELALAWSARLAYVPADAEWPLAGLYLDRIIHENPTSVEVVFEDYDSVEIKIDGAPWRGYWDGERWGLTQVLCQCWCDCQEGATRLDDAGEPTCETCEHFVTTTDSTAYCPREDREVEIVSKIQDAGWFEAVDLAEILDYLVGLMPGRVLVTPDGRREWVTVGRLDEPRWLAVELRGQEPPVRTRTQAAALLLDAVQEAIEEESINEAADAEYAEVFP